MHCNSLHFSFNLSNFNYFIFLVCWYHLIIKVAKMVFKMIFVRDFCNSVRNFLMLLLLLFLGLLHSLLHSLLQNKLLLIINGLCKIIVCDWKNNISKLFQIFFKKLQKSGKNGVYIGSFGNMLKSGVFICHFWAYFYVLNRCFDSLFFVLFHA